MTYRETLDYLYAQLPMYHRIGAAAFKEDLTNTYALCGHLGNPQMQFKSIHVGGTNGKGSVSHLLAAVCQAAGLKTGLYVSPHYKDFRERIKVNGRYITRRQVIDFVESNRAAIERIQPSFFELCVAMAFDHFARERVDVAVIEVGLGGRLDSTNVITPLLSVITNISYDHQNMLGDTLPQIAFEKAGIIKPGIPVAIGETHPESAPVFIKKAAETDSEIVFADQHFEVVERNSEHWQSTFYDVFRINPTPDPSPTGRGAVERSVEDSTEEVSVYSTSPLPVGEGSGVGLTYLENLEVQAAGPYQAKNVATAIQAIEIASRQLLSLDLHAVREGFKNLRSLTRFIGRWQIIGQYPTILCDSAHNEAGLRVAFEKISQLVAYNLQLTTSNSKLRTPNSKLHIVTGFVNDKDLDKVLTYFPENARYYFAKANIPRGLEAQILKEKAAAQGLDGRAYSSVKNALKAARRAAAKEDLIVVIGSIFVVAEVL
jgi:dihydrofolate synthase/folylpolyglutamate synthase